MRRDIRQTLTAGLLCAAPALGLAQPAPAAELPKATQAILAKQKLDAAVLKGLDEELKMPSEWIEGAKKEEELRVGGTWDDNQFQAMTAPFLERYPFVKVKYARATRYDRVIKPLIAYQAGRIMTDVISGVGAKFKEFMRLNAIEDLRVLPNWKNVPDGMKQAEGGWVGQRLRYWCTSYNTNAVKKEDLPKTWDDLVTNPRWHNAKIGLGNRPNLWLLQLWGMNGEAWAKDYARKILFTVKPQLRKEGMNALIGLVIAGEFDMAIPSAAYRTGQMVQKGAPVAWHCPEPVPMAISEMTMIRGSDRRNSALMFINWFLSKEGQVAQYAANLAPPVHKDLQTKEFLMFPDQIVGRKIAFRDPTAMEEELPVLMKYWDPLWMSATGAKIVSVKTTIDKIIRGGRQVAFKSGNETHTVSISGSRTKLSIAGKTVARKELKAGLSCQITYPGDKEEAKEIVCN